MANIGLVFVHGINNNAKERKALPGMLMARLQKYGLGDLFKHISVAEWASCGDFVGDLANIGTDIEKRKRDIQEVMDGILAAIEQLEKPRGLIVAGHSFGQVFSFVAVNRIASSQQNHKPPCPISLMTLGGPLGNDSPWFRGYLSWTPSRDIKLADLGVQEWVDVYNPDDPIPKHPLFGYRAPMHAQGIRVEFPGTPGPFNPLSEHSSYFQMPDVYAELKKMADRLGVAVASE